ncbi:hypothetical protein MED121_04933 [Marinomonas sp. MED121]|nr:hypothetical protein MED121_04933 [Marinomonas sp. MED121]
MINMHDILVKTNDLEFSKLFVET